MSLIFIIEFLSWALITVVSAQDDWTKRQWDAIVVGAGPAGIIVADRLSQANKTTLLLEGGGLSYGITGGRERPDWLNSTALSRVDVPGLYKSIFQGESPLVCNSTSNGFGGCTIGGSSAINAGLFFQPPSSDYDLYFPESWKSLDMQSAIAKLYSRQNSNETTSSDGKMYLQSGYYAAKQWLVDSAGYKNVNINDFADDKFNVFGRPIFDYNNGQRGGPVTTYLQSALNRSNFMLQSGARVERVIRHGELATGVMAKIAGVDTEISLARGGRVILSGGALQSPQLLMYSGIGSLKTLSKLQNSTRLGNLTRPEWIINSAVGEGLFDNPNTFIELRRNNLTSYTYSYDNPVRGDADSYLYNRSGPYTFASETSVFWSYLNNSAGRRVGFQGTIDSSGYTDFNDNHTITLNIYGTSGLGSRGSVVLDDENFKPGASDDVYYSNPQDAVDIATYIRSIFDALPASLEPLNIPRNATIEQIRDYITTPSDYAVGQTNHWSSSCKIGTCVDLNTTVVGTSNIHVVDGSIVEPLTVNPQFGIMAAAERASELILGMNS